MVVVVVVEPQLSTASPTPPLPQPPDLGRPLCQPGGEATVQSTRRSPLAPLPHSRSPTTRTRTSTPAGGGPSGCGEPPERPLTLM